MTTEAAELPERERPRERRSIGPVIVLLAFLVAAGGGALFYYLEHEPMRNTLAQRDREIARGDRTNERLEARVARLERERAQLQERLGGLRTTEETLRTERDQLTRERDQLRQSNEQAQAALAALQEAQATLRERLQAELASGDAQMRDDGDAVTVELGERILFAPGEATLNENGREVLARLATTLAAMQDRDIRVEGHTDATPIRGDDRFPTNWELSTARATTVVRFFEENGVNGDRLQAVGFGQHHPIANNRDPRGRSRNRRIELVLVRAAR